MRICPFTGCKRLIADYLFACRNHWVTLTNDEKRTIFAGYTDYMDRKISLAEFRERQQKVLGERGTA